MLRVKPEALLLICRVLGHMGPSFQALRVFPGCSAHKWELNVAFFAAPCWLPSPAKLCLVYQASWVPITSSPISQAHEVGFSRFRKVCMTRGNSDLMIYK